MNSPLFDVKLKIWESWKHYWNSLSWFLKKLAGDEYKDIGVKRFVAGAYDPHSRTVHLFLDEIGQSAIAHLDKVNLFTSRNYRLELAKELVTTLVHELVHSVDIFSSERLNEDHVINKKKLEVLMKKSMWYAELIRVCYGLDGQMFNVTDSNKEPDNSQDCSE